MTLIEIIMAVKEQNLSKDKLEQYRDTLANLYAEMKLENADIEKEEAKYFFERTNPETSDVSIKRKWRATEMGQRQILLKNYFRAMDKLLDSLRSRLYSIY